MKQPPHSLSDITLSQWVDFQNLYGEKLDNRLIEINNLQGEQKRNAYLLHQFDSYCQKYSFYTGTPLEDIMRMESEDVLPIIKMQGESEIAYKKEQALLDYRAKIQWKGAIWKIQPIFPKTAQMTAAQFEMSQDIALIISDLQDGKHEALYALCASYLRKIAEPYSEDLMNSRISLMKELPLSISLCVKMYMEWSINEYLKQSK